MKTLPIFMICITLLCACNKKEDEIQPAGCVGQIFTYTSPFAVNASSIDFRTDQELQITASFDRAITWKVTLEGSVSQAKKVYSGHSNAIAISWKGTPGDSKFFKSDEDIKVTLSIPCAESVEKTFRLVKERDYNKTGILVSDFEGKGYVYNEFVLGGYSNSGWSSYFTESVGTLSTFKSSTSPLIVPQGNNYMTIKGKAAAPSWFVGGYYINAPYSFNDYTPDDTYFNAMISSGDNTTTTLGITFMQSDAKKFTYVLPIDWKGWKLVSFKMSELKDGSGNTFTDLNKILNIDFGLNCASKQGQSTEVNMDMVIFTKGESLNN